MGGLLQRLRHLDPLKGWLFLYEPVAAVPGSEASLIKALTDRFIACARVNDLEGALQTGRSILGRGGGLTPSV